MWRIRIGSDWRGNQASTRFAMSATFEPTLTAEGWQLSNAPMLSLSALHEALCLFDKVDLLALREKKNDWWRI